MHKLLVDEFYDDSFALIAIHCGLEDYRLAYLINQFLNVHLARKSQDLDYKYFSATYSIYEWEDTKQYTTWNLISNVCKKEEDSLQSSGSLFNSVNTVLKTYNLLPEFKTVDFFLKISNEENAINETQILKTIQSMPNLITSYLIDPDHIKSKDNLIF